MKILVTGVQGYIGATVAAALLAEDHDVVGLDDGSNGDERRVSRLELTFPNSFTWFQGSVGDLPKELLPVLDEVEGCVHCAGSKYADESFEKASLYWLNNVCMFGELLKQLGIREIPVVFSSSASVYGPTDVGQAVSEGAPLNPQSPYAQTKVAAEHLVQAFCRGFKLKGLSLRYFNPVGKGVAGLGDIGVNPRRSFFGALEDAVRYGKPITLNGLDHPTPDGSAYRDFIHVQDLADVHVLALEWLVQQKKPGAHVMNVGYGEAVSLLQVQAMVQKATQNGVTFLPGGHRVGDLSYSCADVTLMKSKLKWKPSLSVEEAVRGLLG